ncbi:DUF2970 domain-containing protein [Marinospirillum perlucidum]|uniref:DUF2970 domain-containing protein n=1 Tax=Marinospirillum perlucidum TaxID=1982602 RepID=UPI000DF478D1|nr:DUF2970 domain-containing protein [Marinospirillum perlucidum]
MWRVLQAVLAAFFGVQSERKRREDFQQSSPWPFILTGVLMTLVFVVAVGFLAHWASS